MKYFRTDNPGRVAFFVPWYRATNETFVSNELYAFAKRGIVGTIYYEKLKKTSIQPVNKLIPYPSHYILGYPFQNIRGHRREKLFSHLSLLFAHPLEYIRAIVFFCSMPIPKDRDLFILMGLIAARLRSDGTSLIYIHDGKWISFIGILCSLLSGIPCGIIFHTEYVFAHPEDLSRKLANATFSIFQSQYSKQYVITKTKKTQVYKQHMHVISSPGVNIDFFTPCKKKKTKKSIRIISIGRLEEMKGFDRLIQAVKILRDERRDVTCVIVGYGSQKTRLKRLIRTLRLEKYVLLAGPVGHTKRLLKLMNEADIFVLPSRIDSKNDRDMQPNAIKEAMAMKLIVITSELGGIREVIRHGYNGFLIPSATTEHIVRMIQHILMISKEERDAVRHRARETIIEKYNEESITRRLISVFLQYTGK